MMIAYLYFI